MFEAGELESVHAPPTDQVARLADDPAYEIYRYPQPSSMYLTLNWEHTALGFDDVRVRRAFSLAIDRPEIVATALSGCGSPTWGPLPPGLEFYDPSIDAAGVTDVRGAAAQLDAAGFLRGVDGIRERDGHRMVVPCVLQDDEQFRRVGDVVAKQLARIGIVLQLSFAKPFVEFYEACQPAPTASINKWLWQDPMDALIGFCASDKRPFLNWSNASSPQLDAAFEAWTRGESADDLQVAATRAQAAFAEDLPYVPLLTPDDVWVWRARFSGCEPAPGTLYPNYHGLHIPDEA
jgi:ABC-type transport system substrate-binding protein